MTPQEHAILDAINFASTRHRDERGYGCTAAQIAEVLNTDERLAAEYAPALLALNGRQIGNHLALLCGARAGFTDRTENGHRPPLVARYPDRPDRVYLTHAALDALGA